jgi:hypothetical protein
VTLRDFSSTATCYPEPNGRVRPEAIACPCNENLPRSNKNFGKMILKILSLPSLTSLAVLLSLLSGSLHAAPVRNEALASRFIYCADVSQFFYEYLSKNEPANPGINGFRESKNAFWLAAAVVSDGAYLTREKQIQLGRVLEILQQEKLNKTNLMDEEASSCLKTLQNEAIPVLKPKSSTEPYFQ